jgi:hypothetical protein
MPVELFDGMTVFFVVLSLSKNDSWQFSAAVGSLPNEVWLHFDKLSVTVFFVIPSLSKDEFVEMVKFR